MTQPTDVRELIDKLWDLHRRGVSYASDKPAVNLLLADLSEGIRLAANALSDIERLEGALRPFSEAADKADQRMIERYGAIQIDNDTTLLGCLNLTLGHVRNARAALNKEHR